MVIQFTKLLSKSLYWAFRRLYAQHSNTIKKYSATMADTMEIVPNEGIFAFPPLPGVAPLVHMPGAGDGQNWPSATEGSADEATTPNPPQHILVPQASSAIL